MWCCSQSKWHDEMQTSSDLALPACCLLHCDRIGLQHAASSCHFVQLVCGVVALNETLASGVTAFSGYCGLTG
jgi:hypothetical protein